MALTLYSIAAVWLSEGTSPLHWTSPAGGEIGTTSVGTELRAR